MADERDFELLDDYLTHRMGEQDRTAFEQRLKADPDLQHEYALQKRLIQGIKDARIAELKSMLNKVPVPAVNTGNTIASKIILGTVMSLIIAGAAYWFLKDEELPVVEKVQTQQNEPAAKLPAPEAPAQTEEAKPEVRRSERQPAAETDKNQTSAGTEHSKPSLARRPDPLSAPAARDNDSAEDSESEDPANTGINSSIDEGPLLTPMKPSIVVETQANSTRYTFHYQLRDGKLILFGPFEKEGYRVMEFQSNGRREVFLSYKDQFYQLQDSLEQAKPLNPVKDPALNKKLTEYRDLK